VAQKRKANFSLVRQYDKLLAVLVLVGLLVSLFMLARYAAESQENERGYRSAIERVKPEFPQAAPLDLTPFKQAQMNLHQPKTLNDSTNDANLFIPEKRVWCLGCHYPIPYNATNCPYCQAEQPPDFFDKPIDMQTLDSDGDGMPDWWEKKYGFDPFNPADAAEDADGDGFSNLEEYLAGTNPRDPNSHPDYATKAHCKEIRAQTFPFVFTSASKMKDGKYKCAFNMKAAVSIHEANTLWAYDGEPVGKTGITLVKYEEKKEQRFDPRFNKTNEVDISYVVLKYGEDNKQGFLHRDDPQGAMEQEVVLELALVGSTNTFTIPEGGYFDLKGQKYKVDVKDVDGQPPSVVLENTQTTKRFTVPVR
jgi:hypothetical protein